MKTCPAATGTDIDEMNFILPSDANFDVGSNIHKIYHPEGGGIILPQIPQEAIAEVNNDPDPGWYIGRFNNVEWTPSTRQDVIMAAHQLTQQVCAEINKKIIGSSVIPQLSNDNRDFLIDDSLHGGSNSDLMVADCAACEGHPQMCVINNTNDIYSFYSIVAQQ